MKVVSLLIAFWAVLFSFSCQSSDKTLNIDDVVRNGDIIFQSSTSGQSKAIQVATRSKYSHVGIIYIEQGKPFVFEAVQPVKVTPFHEWIERGDDKHFVVKRLKDADELLTDETLLKMRAVGKKFEGKAYDLTFEWTDKRIYCSELVWKIYKRAADVELAKLEQLSDFNLSSPLVRKTLVERYGDAIPLDEKVISPVAIFESNLLTTVVIR